MDEGLYALLDAHLSRLNTTTAVRQTVNKRLSESPECRLSTTDQQLRILGGAGIAVSVSKVFWISEVYLRR